jgi:hypothetical protein
MFLFSGGYSRTWILWLLHKKILPQATLKGWEKGPEGRGRPQIRTAAEYHVQRQGKADLLPLCFRRCVDALHTSKEFASICAGAARHGGADRQRRGTRRRRQQAERSQAWKAPI